ncbi:hypothetical protein AB0K18_45670 [Nonomuraea sp. NPDC049421]|uniref:hypothetical protein n=1 Tax=Nonomuraea sp. NPDC049421 TaxID=3155275 RepID=UPI003417C8F0
MSNPESSTYEGFTAEEGAAMKEHGQDQKKAARRSSHADKAARRSSHADKAAQGLRHATLGFSGRLTRARPDGRSRQRGAAPYP